jgi:hypothetical protein
MKKSEIITLIMAGYGAVLSTIAILRQYFADRTKVRVTVRSNMEMVGDPRYAGKSLIIMEVINLGRRPVQIRTAGAMRLHPNTNLVFPDTRPALPCELTEGKYVTVVVDQEGVDFSTIDYWAAWDSHDRLHQKREASWFSHVKSRLQQKWAFRKGKKNPS